VNGTPPPPGSTSRETYSSPAGPAAAQPREQMVRIDLPARKPVVTYTLIAVTAVIFLLQLASQSLFGGDLLLALGAKVNSYIRAGELWRLFTPMFLHVTILHIAFNMYALFVLGPGLERQFGPWRYLALYLLSGFTGNVMSFIFSSAASAGASTAIFGLLGGQIVLVYQNRQLFGGRFRSILFNTVFIAAVNLIIGLSPGIDNWGHLGGLIGGTLFAWFAGPLWRVEGLYPTYKLVDRRGVNQALLAALGVAILFAAAFVLALTRSG
jgi:rhomboid protease GluP